MRRQGVAGVEAFRKHAFWPEETAAAGASSRGRGVRLDGGGSVAGSPSYRHRTMLRRVVCLRARQRRFSRPSR
jgi:hypothetical protein